ncbi:uncharacterized protein [Physcomitrium patens]|uniref:Sel1 repeat family protein n=1 Tax=Physcomitrium patens TaxID=3218 RepID=A0A7I4BLB7_PHYPA|nr:uncharacterized protein LOC112272774 isoform X2 [Physcomitrium patens]XP_024356642.1 uncharacterized protein LOC112272774 isoform X2 [Physcomitrium patens]|eukprot:XP_024356641.1 uncharacterized protein LOC112272774 isoform X2 [Physcomitrella patens]
MPHWWTPCIEAYPIRMPDRNPAKVKSIGNSADPEFPKAIPLREVVANCEHRWFEQTLKAAKSGDISSQCLVGQMFCSGYGVPVNVKKGKYWLQKAAELDMEARSLLASLSVGRSVESYMEEPEARQSGTTVASTMQLSSCNS